MIELVVYRRHIPELLGRLNAKRIVEVGVNNGRHLRRLLMAPSVEKAWAVDPWLASDKFSENESGFTQDEFSAQMNRVLEMAQNDARISVFRADSLEAASELVEESPFDFVYIDADHTYEATLADMRAWWPLVRDGGVLAGHDYGMPGKYGNWGVERAVREFAKEHKRGFHVDRETDWFIQK